MLVDEPHIFRGFILERVGRKGAVTSKINLVQRASNSRLKAFATDISGRCVYFAKRINEVLCFLVTLHIYSGFISSPTDVMTPYGAPPYCLLPLGTITSNLYNKPTWKTLKF